MKRANVHVGIFVVAMCFALLCGACSSVLSRLYGIRQPTTQSREEILSAATLLHIAEKDCFELDTAFAGFLRQQDTAKYRQEINNHRQPLQVFYYSRDGKFLSYYVNCYAGGFPNLNWNIKGFVPPSQAPLDSLLPLDTHMLFLKSLSQAANGRDNPDYWVVVYWNRFMGRQSRRLLAAVQQNVKDSGKNVKVFYVNNDNFLYGLLNAQ